MKKLLEGIRVIDWTQFLNGATAGVMLGDLGAEIIHIERPKFGDSSRGVKSLYDTDMSLPKDRNLMVEFTNRNKKSVVLDLSKEKGQQVLYRLVSRSDVFLTNFHRGIARKLKVDYENLRVHNPKLIYATASGYGGRGPEAEKRAFDPIGQARSGLMFALGDRDQTEPLQAEGALLDQLGSTLTLTGILGALVCRELQGIGQEIDNSILGGAIHLQGLNITSVLLKGRANARHSRNRSRNPLSNMYQCADGKWILLAEPQSDRFWKSFCEALGVEDMVTDLRFSTADARRENCQQCIRILVGAFAKKPREEWLKILQEKGGGLTFDRISTHEELANDSQILANDYIVDYDHEIVGPIKLVGFPVHFSETPAQIQRRAPEFGEHTEEVLIEVGGYTWEEIAELQDEGVI